MGIEDLQFRRRARSIPITISDSSYSFDLMRATGHVYWTNNFQHNSDAYAKSVHI